MDVLRDKRVLVVGGAGFIGSHVVDLLVAESVSEVVVLDNLVRGTRENLAAALRDPRVRLIEGSVTDPELLRTVMRGVDYVIHLAALWLHECVHEPRAAIDVNIAGTWNVVEAAVEASVRKVVYSSSASVYGNAVFTPMTEEHPFANRTMYGATKIAGEQFFRVANEQHGLDYVGLRYMNVYGPRMDYRGTYVSVLMKVLDRIDAGHAPIIFGDGSQSYDFVDVRDVARANLLALRSPATDECFNVGTGVPTTIDEVVSLLLRETGSTLTPEYRPGEQMFVTQRIGSTQRAEERLGFRAEISLEEGIRALAAWRKADRLAAQR